MTIWVATLLGISQSLLAIGGIVAPYSFDSGRRVSIVARLVAGSFTENAATLPLALPSVLGSPWVALRAMSLQRSLRATADVLIRRDKFKVFGAYTMPYTAQVVPYHACGRTPDEELVRLDAVESSVAVPVESGCPEPASLSLINLHPEPRLNTLVAQVQFHQRVTVGRPSLVMHRAHASCTVLAYRAVAIIEKAVFSHAAIIPLGKAGA